MRNDYEEGLPPKPIGQEMRTFSGEPPCGDPRNVGLRIFYWPLPRVIHSNYSVARAILDTLGHLHPLAIADSHETID